MDNVTKICFTAVIIFLWLGHSYQQGVELEAKRTYQLIEQVKGLSNGIATIHSDTFESRLLNFERRVEERLFEVEFPETYKFHQAQTFEPLLNCVLSHPKQDKNPLVMAAIIKLCNLPTRDYFEPLELRSPLFLNCVAEKAKGQPDNKQSILNTIGFCDTYESKEHREITNQIERLNNEWTSPMLPQKN